MYEYLLANVQIRIIYPGRGVKENRPILLSVETRPKVFGPV